MVTRHSLPVKILFGILVFLIVLFSIFPFVQMISTSLKHPWDWKNPSLIPKHINTTQYARILGLTKTEVDESAVPDSIKKLLANKKLTPSQREAILAKYQKTSDVFPYLRYFANSFLVAGLGAFTSLCIAVLGAYAFSRLRFFGRLVIQRGVLFSYMFGGILLLIPLYRMASSFGLLRGALGSTFALIVIYIVQTLPVSLYMLGNYFRSIPYSIEESAIMEGCSRLSIIWRVIIPLSSSAIVTVFIYSFIIAWNEYLFASVFISPYPSIHTLPIGLKAIFGSKNAAWDLVMSASVLTCVPVIAIFSIIQRRLISGLSSGAVKG